VLTWVIYDISEDKTRTRVAKRCLDFGLYRVQKSVFLGEVPPNRVDEIVQFSLGLIDPATDAVFVFPMCREDFDKVRVAGQRFDRKLVADEVLTQII
jgi:CRISPR-associated protein Cas2